ncbi:hypothetical protein FPSE_07329 [Fusarium pseudograminearum CS3096]|uniref:Uncharacterized protein n=1 Tax=Fusarium pseudograminearum (strain CS3096) TaxID=1028729 RepID=K3VHE2_FUSPC|nr:hypothetical protein FPSE_07329 [Fusarium pseudograminearum CS3096]EKJ72448.1 hypothetical protein FPSE_07329 [Fusarium pseudograminearum CS3096]KAF0637683.1 hypothetical protein FPSE5266_07329 [Fusarium pseudograminearum]
MNVQKPAEKTREQSIAEFDARTRKIQQDHPDVDFKSTVIEPTMNLMFDIKETLTEKDRTKHEELISLMLQNTSDPEKAEKYLWEARNYLKPHPEVLKLFDDIYINKRPVSVMISQLHDAINTKPSLLKETQTDTKVSTV